MDIGTVAAIASPIIGGIMGNKAAKQDAAAQRYAAEMNARAYEDARPYIKDLYKGGTDALNKALEAGAYSGSTFAGMNPLATEGYNYMANFGRGSMGDATGFMGSGGGFGSNYSDIYNRAAAPTLDNAINYATNSPQAQSLIDAAMMQSERNLYENQLPGVANAANATGNTNSSRNFMESAILKRGNADRRANVSSNVFNNLTNQYLRNNTQDINNMMAANAGLKNTYGIGFGMAPKIGDMLTTSGNAFQNNQQGFLDAERDAFVRDRDFAMNQYGDYNAKILGRAPQSSSQRPITANPYTATFGGAMAGLGFGNQLSQLFAPTPATPHYPGKYGSVPGGF